MSKDYTTPIASDLMKAFKEGWKRGAISNQIVGWSIGLVMGFTLAMYAGVKLEAQEKN